MEKIFILKYGKPTKQLVSFAQDKTNRVMLGGCKATEHNRHCDACGERWRLISEPQDVEAGSGGGRDEESDAVDNK